MEADEYAKDDVRDFALWKGPKPGEPSWSTAHRRGSARLAHRVLGDEHGPPRRPSFDIHTGGIDLIFPHHEDEIAQSEAATGQPFVQTWLHCAHLQSSGTKMAKSTGNIARPGELFEAGVSPRALRYALLAVHYRASLSHSDESLAAAAAGVGPAGRACRARSSAYREDGARMTVAADALADAREAFGAALDDDLNISEALAALFDLVRDLNRRIEARSPLDRRTRPGRSRCCATWTRCSACCRTPAEELDPEIAATARRTGGGSRRRGTGRPRTDSATSCWLGASRSRTPATASAGAAWWR